MTVETLSQAGERFDMVLAMDVVEHVPHGDQFVQTCAELTDPGGLMIVSTISRTLRSLLSAIVMGEYVLRLIPRGSHQWHRFRTPDEIGTAISSRGLRVTDISGVSWDFFAGALRLSASAAVTYLLTAGRPA